MLCDPARHEVLTATPLVRRRSRRRHRAHCRRRGWPLRPGCALADASDGRTQGRRSVLHALFRRGGRHLRVAPVGRGGRAVHAKGLRAAVATLLERNRARTREWDADVPSLLFGDVGIPLLQWQVAPTGAIADAIFGAVERNLRNPTLEQLWGSPGTLPAAIHMFEWTGERRWSDLLTRGVTILWEQMERVPEAGPWLWTQELYGRTVRYLGGGHGFAGNVFPALRGAHMLSADLVAGYAQRTEETLRATALRDAGLANWPPQLLPPGESPPKMLVQDCHGAPGIICRLPTHTVTALDDLLLEAGELVWRAGPLAKGAGLCHGTAGNGYAFLKLYRRSRDPRWLDRARAFAMHSIEQCDRAAVTYGQRRYSLWTGDPGVALFVQGCRLADDTYPTLDVF